MKKKLVATLVAVAGSLVFAGTASAQTYQGNTTTNDPISGSYHIVLTQNSPTTFSVNSIQANTGSQTPSAPISGIKVVFYNGANGIAPIIDVTGVGVGGVNPGGSGNAWNSVKGGPVGSEYAVFNTQNGAPFLSNMSTGPNGIFSQTMFGFSGAITLASAPTPVRSVLFTLTDSNAHQYTYYDYVNTPESASVWLLVAALLPMAVIGMRRRRSMQQ